MNLQLPLTHGDSVVTAFPFRDKVFVITKSGDIWMLQVSDIDDLPTIRKVQT